jgi:XTP/dITP diphosphohydrolase
MGVDSIFAPYMALRYCASSHKSEDEVEKLLLASGNPGKLSELRALLTGFKLIEPQTLGVELQIDEIGETYLENALLKAAHYAHETGQWTLADDSGLEVDALDGAPGLHSNRLLGPGRSDAERRAKLLELLQPHTPPWTARFRCGVALIGPDGERMTAEGVCPGSIIPSERGQNGFGYDPIFLIDSTNKTMAELTMDEKNNISHRAQAVKALLPEILIRLG